jgi:hypothetical protein
VRDCWSKGHEANASEERNPRILRRSRPRLRRAAKVARETTRMYGTPIYIVKNSKIVAEKPRGSVKSMRCMTLSASMAAECWVESHRRNGIIAFL